MVLIETAKKRRKIMSEKALASSGSPFSYSLIHHNEESDENDKESVCVSSYFDDRDGNCLPRKFSFASYHTQIVLGISQAFDLFLKNHLQIVWIFW